MSHDGLVNKVIFHLYILSAMALFSSLQLSFLYVFGETSGLVSTHHFTEGTDASSTGLWGTGAWYD